MVRKSVILLFLVFVAHSLSAQFAPTTNVFRNDTGFTMGALIIMGKDTVPHVKIREVVVFPLREFKNPKEAERFSRLVYNVKKVYPYSLLIKKTLYDINNHLASLKTEKERKEYLKQAEKTLRAQFEGQITQLSYNQGRILIKLVDRETGQTTYEVLKQLKGTFQAIFWQSIARIFGSNLKSEYDAKGEDLMIEEIVVKIEQGQL